MFYLSVATSKYALIMWPKYPLSVAVLSKFFPMKTSCTVAHRQMIIENLAALIDSHQST